IETPLVFVGAGVVERMGGDPWVAHSVTNSLFFSTGRTFSIPIFCTNGNTGRPKGPPPTTQPPPPLRIRIAFPSDNPCHIYATKSERAGTSKANNRAFGPSARQARRTIAQMTAKTAT